MLPLNELIVLVMVFAVCVVCKSAMKSGTRSFADGLGGEAEESASGHAFLLEAMKDQTDPSRFYLSMNAHHASYYAQD